jgi:DNA polymerase-3 subunit delta'
MASVWDPVVGQDHAVGLLRQLVDSPVHGYLFIGPEGCGKEQAARAFASCLITGSEDATTNEARLIAEGSYIDVHEVRREGAAISADQAQDLVLLASRSPVESKMVVIILHDIHFMSEAAVVRLLKTFEEPSDNVRFILLTDSVIPLLVTVASRCVNVTFGEIPTETIEQTLVAEGIAIDLARSVALGARGSLERARLLAADPGYAARRDAFVRVPRELDGSGHRATSLVSDLVGRIDAAAAPLEEIFERELDDLKARIKISGERGSGKKDLEDSQKRRLRKHKTDELRSGLSVMAGVYRDVMSHAHNAHRIGELAAAVDDIHKTMGRLALNVNEELLLQALFLRLPVVRDTDFVG